MQFFNHISKMVDAIYINTSRQSCRNQFHHEYIFEKIFTTKIIEEKNQKKFLRTSLTKCIFFVFSVDFQLISFYFF